jgi:hypothetical protein
VEPTRARAGIVVDGTAQVDRVVDQVLHEMRALGWEMDEGIQCG